MVYNQQLMNRKQFIKKHKGWVECKTCELPLYSSYEICKNCKWKDLQETIEQIEYNERNKNI